MNTKTRPVFFVTFISAAACFCSFGCVSPPPEFRTIAAQNMENSALLAANASLAVRSLERLVAIRSSARLQSVRHRVSQQLIARMLDPGARAPTMTPAVTSARLERDARELDAINMDIANGGARSHEDRDMILDAYDDVIAEKLRQETAARSVRELVETIEEQATISITHARSIEGYAGGRGDEPAVIRTLGHPDLHSAIVELVRTTKGDEAADDLARRLRTLTEALDILTGLPLNNTQDQ